MKHMRQSANGCVMCERRWSEHSEWEQSGATEPVILTATEAEGLRELLAFLSVVESSVSAHHKLDMSYEMWQKLTASAKGKLARFALTPFALVVGSDPRRIYSDESGPDDPGPA